MPLCLATLFRFLKARRAPFPHRSSSCRALDGKSGCRRESIQRLLCSQTDATLRKISQQNVNITGRHLLGQRILVLLIATCSWGSYWRVWKGRWRLLLRMIFHRTILYGRWEFLLAGVFKWWWPFFLQLCEFILLEFPYMLLAVARSQRRRSAELLLSSAALRSTRRH